MLFLLASEHRKEESEEDSESSSEGELAVHQRVTKPTTIRFSPKPDFKLASHSRPGRAVRMEMENLRRQGVPSAMVYRSMSLPCSLECRDTAKSSALGKYHTTSNGSCGSSSSESSPERCCASLDSKALQSPHSQTSQHERLPLVNVTTPGGRCAKPLLEHIVSGGEDSGHESSTEKEKVVSPVHPTYPPTESWSMRLFQSKLFNMSIAIHYLFNSKEPGVQAYLGNKLFSFPDEDVDFFLPQLINMYIQMEDLSEALHKYFLFRCKNSVLFSLKMLWLLSTYTTDTWIPSTEAARGSRLLHLIQSEKIRPPSHFGPGVAIPASSAPALSPVKKHHHRSLSAGVPSSSSCTNLSMVGRRLHRPGDLHSGRAFDSGCTCVVPTQSNSRPLLTRCVCSAPRLVAQNSFVSALGNVCRRLLRHRSRELRMAQLYAELSELNLNLPARVCVPLRCGEHQVLRIPSSEAVVLNSKTKAPYLIHIEVAECTDTFLSPLPAKQLDVNLQSAGLSLYHAKVCIRSEGASPGPGRKLSCVPRAESVSSREHIDSDGDEPVFFSVGQVRQRLVDEIHSPEQQSLARDPEDPSVAVMKEAWEEKEKRIRASSPYGHLPNWKLLSVIVKWGDDLRQELLASQLLEQFQMVWEQESVPLWIRPYQLLVVSANGGLIEPIPNAISLHQVKKQCEGSLKDYFVKEYGGEGSEQYIQAQKNFVASCAGYCLVTYFMQVKDRHNGNILLDSEGHLIHIDYGFILASSPGKNLKFENSPFKLTLEFVEVMGGVESEQYEYFKLLMLRGFMAARKHMDKFIQLVEIMQTGSQLQCFGHGPSTVRALQDRFCLFLTEKQLELTVSGMIEASLYSIRTKLYDGFQYLTNGIR